MSILAFSYEADMHCIYCARERFGEDVMHTSDGMQDNEGNPPHPVFSHESQEEDKFRCGTCGEIDNF